MVGGRADRGLSGGDRPAGDRGPARAGLRLQLLDESLQPVPVGRPGWIFAVGSFTGDLGRLLSDSRLEILARSESLVPVASAYDPEVEVESVLRSHLEILESAVTAWEDETGERHLVAHYATRAPASPSVTELNGYLKTRLPRALVPALFVHSPRLPVTAGGRIDRRALPSPADEGLRAVAPFVPPCRSREVQLKQIWEELFGFRPIGIRDDFFELGGHSLLAIRLMTRIRKELGRDLRLSALLHASTIEELALAIEQQDETQIWSPLVPLQSAGTRPPLFCIHALGGEVLSYVDLARFLGPDQPVYGLQARAWSPSELEDLSSLEEIAAEYITAIRSVQTSGPYRILGYSLGGVLALEMSRQLHTQGEEVCLLAILDTLMTGERGRLSTCRDPRRLGQLPSMYICREFASTR